MYDFTKGNNSQMEKETGLGAELEKELAILRKRDSRKTLIMGSIAAVVLVLSAAVYVSAGPDNSLLGNAQGNANYQLAAQGGGTAFGGAGSCCSTGSGGGGGGCGASAGAAAGERWSQGKIQQSALVQYEKDTGNKPAKGVINDFGCHIQCDILDDTGVIVASYGYQGGDSLYRIK